MLKSRTFPGRRCIAMLACARQISQGLILPISILGSGDWELGQDVTDILGVRKWEIEERASDSGTIVAGLPGGVPKTEECRIQAEPGLLDEFVGKPYYITTKMDGTSVTFFRIEGRFGVCGHNYEYADDGKCSFWSWAHDAGLEQRIVDAGLDDIVLQGEFCGGGIQQNPLKLTKPAWYLFTVVDAKTHRRLSLNDMRDIALSLGLRWCPSRKRARICRTRVLTSCLSVRAASIPVAT